MSFHLTQKSQLDQQLGGFVLILYTIGLGLYGLSQNRCIVTCGYYGLRGSLYVFLTNVMDKMWIIKACHKSLFMLLIWKIDSKSMPSEKAPSPCLVMVVFMLLIV